MYVRICFQHRVRPRSATHSCATPLQAQATHRLAKIISDAGKTQATGERHGRGDEAARAERGRPSGNKIFSTSSFHTLEVAMCVSNIDFVFFSSGRMSRRNQCTFRRCHGRCRCWCGCKTVQAEFSPSTMLLIFSRMNGHFDVDNATNERLGPAVARSTDRHR